jgi:hypothetical protein
MSELQATLEDLSLHEYQYRLVRHGFDTWDNLAGIKETDIAALGIKLGHRRRLQQENSRRLGHPAKEPLSDLPAAAPQARAQNTTEDRITHMGRPNKQCGSQAQRRPWVAPKSDSGYVAYARFLCQDPLRLRNLLENVGLSFLAILRTCGTQALQSRRVQTISSSHITVKSKRAVSMIAALTRGGCGKLSARPGSTAVMLCPRTVVHTTKVICVKAEAILKLLKNQQPTPSLFVNIRVSLHKTAPLALYVSSGHTSQACPKI